MMSTNELSRGGLQTRTIRQFSSEGGQETLLGDTARLTVPVDTLKQPTV